MAATKVSVLAMATEAPVAEVILVLTEAATEVSALVMAATEVLVMETEVPVAEVILVLVA